MLDMGIVVSLQTDKLCGWFFVYARIGLRWIMPKRVSGNKQITPMPLPSLYVSGISHHSFPLLGVKWGESSDWTHHTDRFDSTPPNAELTFHVHASANAQQTQPTRNKATMRQQQKSKQSSIHSKLSDRKTERSQMTCTHFAYTRRRIVQMFTTHARQFLQIRSIMWPMCWLCALQAAVDSQNEWLGCALARASATNGVSEELTQRTPLAHIDARAQPSSVSTISDWEKRLAAVSRECSAIKFRCASCWMLGRAAALHISCFCDWGARRRVQVLSAPTLVRCETAKLGDNFCWCTPNTWRSSQFAQWIAGAVVEFEGIDEGEICVRWETFQLPNVQQLF